jgi:hypothetical protein
MNRLIRYARTAVFAPLNMVEKLPLPPTLYAYTVRALIGPTVWLDAPLRRALLRATDAKTT